MRTLSTRCITLYCWNLTTCEIFSPLNLEPCLSELPKEMYWTHLFLNIDKCTLCFSDFWEFNTKERIPTIWNGRELNSANYLKDKLTGQKKYRRRFFRNDNKMNLFGKKAIELNGYTYLLLCFINQKTEAIRLSVFSKKTNEFIATKFYYYETGSEKMLKDFAKQMMESTTTSVQMLGTSNPL